MLVTGRKRVPQLQRERRKEELCGGRWADSSLLSSSSGDVEGLREEERCSAVSVTAKMTKEERVEYRTGEILCGFPLFFVLLMLKI